MKLTRKPSVEINRLSFQNENFTNNFGYGSIASLDNSTQINMLNRKK